MKSIIDTNVELMRLDDAIVNAEVKAQAKGASVKLYQLLAGEYARPVWRIDIAMTVYDRYMICVERGDDEAAEIWRILSEVIKLFIGAADYMSINDISAALSFDDSISTDQRALAICALHRELTREKFLAGLSY